MSITKETLLGFSIEEVRSAIRAHGIIEIARVLGAFWTYDYVAAKEGRLGLHAELKSGLHSDGFFVSRILLEPENVRREIARMMSGRIEAVCGMRPEFVVGIPDGATALGNFVADIFGSKKVEMAKEDGHMVLHTLLPAGSTVQMVEDFCTRGTGFIEAVEEITLHCPAVIIMPYDPVIINRGGLTDVTVDGVGTFKVLPLVEKRIQDWTPEECPLCKLGSKPIKPKATDENWYQITTSQNSNL